jgi:hypothetical protein
MEIKKNILPFCKRIILYQYLLVFSILRLREAYKFHYDFYIRFSKLLFKIGLSPKFLKKMNTEIEYKIYLICIIVLSCLSILGVKFFMILTGITSIFTAFLYFSPDDNRYPLNLKLLKEKLPIQFLLFFVLGVGIISNAFLLSESDYVQKPFEVKKEIKPKKEIKQKKD